MELEQSKKQTTLLAAATLAIALCLFYGLLGVRDRIPNESIGKLWSTAFPLLVAYWVFQDAKLRKISSPYSNGFLLVMLWPFLVPAYAFRLQRGKGILIFIGLIVVFLSPALAYVLGYSLAH